MIKLGRASYMGEIQELFNPVVTVGNYTAIASGVKFYGNCEHPWVMDNKAVSNYPFKEKGWGEYIKCGSRGKITIGSDVWIGEDVHILDGVSIADGAIVALGSVVASDVPPYSVYAGNPGTMRRVRFTYPQIIQLMKIRWWEWPDEKVKEALPYMSDITKFIERYG